MAELTNQKKKIARRSRDFDLTANESVSMEGVGDSDTLGKVRCGVCMQEKQRFDGVLCQTSFAYGNALLWSRLTVMRSCSSTNKRKSRICVLV